MALDMNVALRINAGVTGQQAVDQLRTSMDRLDNAAGAVSKGFGLAKAAVGAFAVVQAAQVVLTFAKNTIDAADALNDMSERSGIAVGTLSELEFAAKMNGSSLDEMQAALTKVSVKATDAATGNKTAAVAFDALGIAVKNADGSMRSSLEITEDIGDALKGISDPTLKSALAVEIFGKSGAKLIPVLENMQSAREEARDLGAVVGEDFVKSAAEFNDNMDRMAFMSKGFASTILADVLPALGGMFKEMTTGLKVFGSFGSALWNIGTSNPFRTPAENAVAYGKELGALESQVQKLRASGRVNDADQAAILEPRLENLRKTVEYYEKIAGIQNAGGGRGFVNPPSVTKPQPDAAAIMAKLAGTKGAEEADKAAKKAAEERAQVLKGLNDEILKLTQGEEALTIAKLKELGATPQQIAQAQELMRQRAGLLAGDRELDAATKESTKLTEDATRAKEQLADAGKRLYDETRTPAEKLNIELARLNDLLAQGVINWDTYSRAVFKAQDDFDAVGKKGTDTMEALKDAVDGWGRQATDAFVDFAFTGKASFGDLVGSILKDMARMVIQTQVAKRPLATWWAAS